MNLKEAAKETEISKVEVINSFELIRKKKNRVIMVIVMSVSGRIKANMLLLVEEKTTIKTILQRIDSLDSIVVVMIF